MRHGTSRLLPRHRGLVTFALIGSLLGALFTAIPATAAVREAPATVSGGIAKTAPVAGFSPGNIISDELFYDADAMSATAIQAFLDARIGQCLNGRCLNVSNASISSRTALHSESTGNLICSSIQGGTMKVSELIYRVQVACGISAKVILVTLQKEQGLTTSSAPSDWNLRAAMGASCPDSAPCDPAFSGLGPQILKGAQQLKTYKAARFARQPGNHFIGYHTNASCGGTTVSIQNYATAALYNYTPYQPNAASLNAGFGLGDGCSSYGNRNFYNYYTQWFGSTQQNLDPCRQPSTVETAAGEVITTAELRGRAAPSTECADVRTVFPKGKVLVRVGVHGSWTQVRVDSQRFWVHSDYITSAPEPAWSATRLSGANRFETAAAVAQTAFPSGARTVFLASGADFPDALSAAAAAVKSDGALLLTDPLVLPSATKAELTRLAPDRVILVGGEGAVSSRITSQVSATVPTAAVERIGGIDRYETSLNVARTVFEASGTVYLATGEGFADALAASAAAGTQGAPVVLVDGRASTVSPETVSTLRGLGAGTAILAGGVGVVSEGVASSLTAAGMSVVRHGGADRYATSVLINTALFPGAAPGVVVATGDDYPDALAGAVLAGKSRAPLFSQPANCMTNTAKDWFIASKTTSLTLIGGAGVLGENVARSLRC